MLAILQNVYQDASVEIDVLKHRQALSNQCSVWSNYKSFYEEFSSKKRQIVEALKQKSLYDKYDFVETIQWQKDCSFYADVATHFQYFRSICHDNICDWWLSADNLVDKLQKMSECIKSADLKGFPNCLLLKGGSTAAHLTFHEYSEHLDFLREKVLECVRVLVPYKDDMYIFRNPFRYNTAEHEFKDRSELAYELITVSCDLRHRGKYREFRRSLPVFYQQFPFDEFPNFYDFVKKMMAMLITPCVCDEYVEFID